MLFQLLAMPLKAELKDIVDIMHLLELIYRMRDSETLVCDKALFLCKTSNVYVTKRLFPPGIASFRSISRETLELFFQPLEN
jgi:hypothetical protein